MSDEKDKKPSDPGTASASASTPSGRRPTIDEDEVIVQLGKSIWHYPFRFLGSIILTIAPLIGLFFVDSDQRVMRVGVAGLAAFGLISLLWYIFVTKVCSTYTITRERCTCETGFIKRTIMEVQSRHIRNINVRQGIIQRLFGLGDVEISTAGGAGIEVRFESVHDPLGVRRMIDDFRPSDVD